MRIIISRDMLKFLTKMKCPECKYNDSIEITFGKIEDGEPYMIQRPEGLYIWCGRCSLDYHAPDGILRKRWKRGTYSG